MLISPLLRPSQTAGPVAGCLIEWGSVGLYGDTRNRQGGAGLEILGVLFAGFEPDKIFGGVFSVDMSELIIVFGTITISIVAMVWFGNWWSR
jgi:hypothetical protein